MVPLLIRKQVLQYGTPKPRIYSEALHRSPLSSHCTSWSPQPRRSDPGRLSQLFGGASKDVNGARLGFPAVVSKALPVPEPRVFQNFRRFQALAVASSDPAHEL